MLLEQAPDLGQAAAAPAGRSAALGELVLVPRTVRDRLSQTPVADGGAVADEHGTILGGSGTWVRLTSLRVACPSVGRKRLPSSLRR